MQLFFQNPALFGLLALAALPLLVHLLSRANPPVYQFSNIEFLRKVQRHTSRLRRPKDWLLWLLRTLALVCLAAAFVWPLLISDKAALPGERRTVVCLVDRSASMGASDGATSRFDRACATAAEVLKVANPDLANVVWIDAQPNPVFPEPGPNHKYLSDELSRAGVHSEANAIEAAFDAALRQFPKADGRRELHVISDFQASSWSRVGAMVPEGIDLHLIPVADKPLPNVAVSSLVPVPAEPVVGRELLVKCRVDNHSDEARRVSLTLDAGGSRQSQELDLPAAGAAEASFRIRCEAAGLLPLTAEIEGNDFDADNRRHAVVRVRESLRMGVLGDVQSPQSPQSPDVKSLMRLAGALSWLEADLVSSLDPLPVCDVLVVPAWRGDAAAQLRKAAASGITVLIFAEQATQRAVHTLFDGESGADKPSIPMASESNPGCSAGVPVADHPAYQLFASGEFGSPFEGRFRQRLKLPAIDQAEVLAYHADQEVAVLAATDQALVLANLALHPERSTWTDHPAFVMTVAEWILHFRKGGRHESFTAQPASQIAWTASSELGEPHLQAPGGEILPLVSEQTAEGTRWQTRDGVGVGLYQWTISGQPIHYTAVNFPPSESPLDPLAEPPSVLGASATTTKAERLAELGGGIELWPWLIAMAIFCLLAESVITTLTPRTKAA